MQRSLAVLITSVLLVGCASSGLGVARTSMPQALLPLYDQAKAGDKRAQFSLALAYADGAGVPKDCDQARRLLRLAATETGGTIWVYSPPVGNGTQGRVIPINQGPRQPGLRSAQQLLADPNFCEEPL